MATLKRITNGDPFGFWREMSPKLCRDWVPVNSEKGKLVPIARNTWDLLAMPGTISSRIGVHVHGVQVRVHSGVLVPLSFVFRFVFVFFFCNLSTCGVTSGRTGPNSSSVPARRFRMAAATFRDFPKIVCKMAFILANVIAYRINTNVLLPWCAYAGATCPSERLGERRFDLKTHKGEAICWLRSCSWSLANNPWERSS